MAGITKNGKIFLNLNKINILSIENLSVYSYQVKCITNEGVFQG